jgi:hypothetical protein
MSGAGAPPQSGAARTHQFEAASGQRERVVSAFDVQRDAILKAVDDQRLAAMAPIRAVQARQAQGGTGRAIGAPPAPSQQNVVADIVMTLKALVAEEVRVQLVALLAAAEARQNAARCAAEGPPAG